MVVFLDRDGVINKNRPDYVKSAEELIFLPGVFDALVRLKEAGMPVIVISNQAGVGRGIIAASELDRIDRKLIDGVEEHGGKILATYYCTHRKDEGCSCRKPGTGLFTRAADELGVDLSCSYFIGDAETDMQAGQNAGCKTVLVLSGRSDLSDVKGWTYKPGYIAENLFAAVQWVFSDAEAQVVGRGG